MHRILIADDDVSLRGVLAEFLTSEGFAVDQTDDGSTVVAALTGPVERRPELVIMDVRMPGRTGLEVLSDLRAKRASPLPVIVTTAYGSSSVAIEAMQLGAYDYLTKPFELEDLLATVKRFAEWQNLTDEVITLSDRLAGTDPSEMLIGNSLAMQEVYKTIGRVARSDATVLVSGETGTGKELIATILHRRSSFARGPMVKVNCAALPESLLESELFGHEKGAFTGAIAQRKGRFEMANKGTIFLDEVGEMTLGTQKKLLRVLQEREFERVGGSVTVKIDTRVIAATNKELVTEIAEGRFREDLFYRLNMIPIHLPPLRDRKDDIPLLIEHFLHQERFSADAKPSQISQAALDRLMHYDWPGNVRELANVIGRAVILSQGGVIGEQHIDFSATQAQRFVNIGQRVRERMGLAALLEMVEREAIAEALGLHPGDPATAAATLGLPLKQFRQRLAAAGLDGQAESAGSK